MVATLCRSVLLLMRRKGRHDALGDVRPDRVLGGATIWFHDPTFIKWKPSVLDWAMALALWLSQALFGKNLLQVLVGQQLELPEPVWQRLNWPGSRSSSLMGVPTCTSPTTSRPRSGRPSRSSASPG
jgi:intracellular septation protein